jgi:SLOG cluster4 family
MLGADSAETESGGAVAARLVGIIPSKTVQWRQPSARRLFLDTGLPHNVRNVINGRTPDIVVAFGGNRGTLAEVAFAQAASREVIFYAGLEQLRRNFEKYFGHGSAHTHQETYFEEPLRTYPEASGASGTVSGLISQLGRTLAECVEADCSAVVLADHVEAAARPTGPTGFPRLPGDAKSKDRFETIIEKMSSD